MESEDNTGQTSSTALQPEDTVSLVKSLISAEFRDLKKEMKIGATTDSNQRILKRKHSEDSASFKYSGNKKQFEFNVSVLEKLESVKGSLDSVTVEDVQDSLNDIINDLQGRNKLIHIADKTEGGWSTVEEYQLHDYADNSDDDRKIRQANVRALQKKKRLQRRPTSTPVNSSNQNHLFRGFSYPPRGKTASSTDICFRCGIGGHYRRDCKVQIPIGMQPGSTHLPFPQPIQWGSPAIPFAQAGSARKPAA